MNGLLAEALLMLLRAPQPDLAAAAMCLLVAAVAGQNLDSCFHDPRSLQAIVPSFVRALQRPQVVMVRTAFF